MPFIRVTIIGDVEIVEYAIGLLNGNAGPLRVGLLHCVDRNEGLDLSDESQLELMGAAVEQPLQSQTCFSSLPTAASVETSWPSSLSCFRAKAIVAPNACAGDGLRSMPFGREMDECISFMGSPHSLFTRLCPIDPEADPSPAPTASSVSPSPAARAMSRRSAGRIRNWPVRCAAAKLRARHRNWRVLYSDGSRSSLYTV